MKVNFAENEPVAVRFVVSGIDVSMANALRRVAINSVGSFAIDTITFYENTSAMFDEYISHRVGLVPIITPSKGYDEKDEIVFSLEAEGPATVYSKELESTDRNVKVANQKIPIIKLGNNQRLRIEGKAVLGTASRGARFQPGLATYKLLENGDYEFYIESFGQMPALEIAKKAVEIMKKELKEVRDALKK